MIVSTKNFYRRVRNVQKLFKHHCECFLFQTINTSHIENISLKLFITDTKSTQLSRHFVNGVYTKNKLSFIGDLTSYHLFVEFEGANTDVCWFAYIGTDKKIITPILDKSDNLVQFFSDKVTLYNLFTNLLQTQVFFDCMHNADELSGNETQ